MHFSSQIWSIFYSFLFVSNLVCWSILWTTPRSTVLFQTLMHQGPIHSIHRWKLFRFELRLSKLRWCVQKVLPHFVYLLCAFVLEEEKGEGGSWYLYMIIQREIYEIIHWGRNITPKSNSLNNSYKLFRCIVLSSKLRYVSPYFEIDKI